MSFIGRGSAVRIATLGCLAVLAATSVSAQVPSPNVNVVSGARDKIRGDRLLQRQNEGTIACGPWNPDHCMAAANDYRTVDFAGDPAVPPVGEGWMGVYFTYNGADTFVGGLVPGFPQDTSVEGTSSPLFGLSAASDPVLAVDTARHFYLGGLFFIRGGRSQVAVVRYTDTNDREGEHSVFYDFATVVETGSNSGIGEFEDKPWLAADVPRFPGAGVEDCGNLYMAYATFDGVESNGNFRSKLRFARSTDCGVTFSNPVSLNKTYKNNQGATMAIDPRDGTLYVLWRHYDPDLVLYVKSTDGGQTFSDPQSILEGSQFPALSSFDQPTIRTTPENAADPSFDLSTFRSNAFPVAAFDGQGRLYAAWQERVGADGLPSPTGSPRIVLTMSSNGGTTWTERGPIENGPGPQIMPAMSFGGGLLRVLFYDLRNDGRELSGTTGYISGIDRTIDVRVAEMELNGSGSPALGYDANGNPRFRPSVQVSQYVTFVSKQTGEVLGSPTSGPNQPLYEGGRTAFFGDYNWLTPAAQFVRTEPGSGEPWRWATELGDKAARVSHAVWTDHRDVVPPLTGDWRQYAPPGTGQASCLNPGSRNANLYTAKVSPGIVAGTPQTFKPLVLDGIGVERGFVMYVKNHTHRSVFVRLSVVDNEAGDPSVDGSFLQAQDEEVVDLEILAYSTITRTVYVESVDPTASVRVDVQEVTGIGGSVVAGGLATSVTFNPDPGNPTAGFTNTERKNPQISNPQISNPQISNPQISNPQISNTLPKNPQISNPQISNPQISNTSVSATEVTWTVTNTGDTNVGYTSFSNVPNAEELLSAGYQFQLIIYRTYLNPDYQETLEGCLSAENPLDQVISNIAITDPSAANPQISNPQISNPQISNPQISNPQISNPQISNATFFIAPSDSTVTGGLRATAQQALTGPVDDPTREPWPAEAVKITLRVFPPPGYSSVEEAAAAGLPRFDTDFVEQAVYPQAEEPFVTTLLIETPSLLPDAFVGTPYSVVVQTLGAKGPLTWSAVLPNGLFLDTATGDPATAEISGAPTQIGTFEFTVSLTDGQQNYKKTFTLTVNPGVTNTLIESVLPSVAVVGESVIVRYSVSLGVAGGLTPIGQVTVSVNDGSGAPCSGTVEAAQCEIVFTSTGTKNLIAVFAGDGNYLDSTSAQFSIQVNPAQTTTTITSVSPGTLVVGQPGTVSFAVTVNSPGSGTPTGTVTVNDGSGSSCTGALSSGAGSCSLAPLAAGSGTLNATYSGDANFTGSASGGVSQVVSRATVSVAITSDSPDPSVVGQPVPVSFQVVVTPPGAVILTGGVTVSDGVSTCTGLISSGLGGCAWTATSSGVKTLTATYSGDTNFHPAVSAGTTHQVLKATTTTVVTSDAPDPSRAGEPLVITVNVTAQAPGSGVPTGSAVVDDGNGASCTAVLSGGVATCTLTGLTPGALTLTANYSGDGNFEPSSDTEGHQFTDRFKFIGFLTPLGPEGTYSGVFTLGKTIPVKWQVQNWSGQYVNDLRIVEPLKVGFFGPAVGGVCPVSGTPLAVLAPTGSTQLRSGNQYVFNWDTSQVTQPGCYSILVKLSGTSVKTTSVQLR